MEPGEEPAGDAAPAALGTAELQGLPESLAPKLDLEQLEGRFKAILGEQEELVQLQTKLEEELKAIEEQCKQEQESTDTAEQQRQQQQEELTQKVDEACKGLEELSQDAEQTFPGIQKNPLTALGKVGDAEEGTWGLLAASQQLLGAPEDRVVSLVRKAQEATATVLNSEQQAQAQRTLLQELAVEQAQLTDLALLEQDKVAQLQRELGEKREQLWPDSSQSRRREELQQKILRAHAGELQRSQTRLGYVMKVAAKLAAGAEDDVKVEATRAFVAVDYFLDSRPQDKEKDAAAGSVLVSTRSMRETVRAAFDAHLRAKETRRLRHVVQEWRLQVYAFRALQRTKASLERSAPEGKATFDSLAIDRHLTELQEQADAMAVERVWREDAPPGGLSFAASARAYEDEAAAKLSLVQPCVAKHANMAKVEACEALVTALEKRQETLAHQLRTEEQHAQIADTLHERASAADVQKLVGQIIAIWNEVKAADEAKASRQQLLQTRQQMASVQLSEHWRTGDELVAQGVAETEETYRRCDAEVKRNGEQFSQLETMLAQLATFVEEMVGKLQDLERA